MLRCPWAGREGFGTGFLLSPRLLCGTQVIAGGWGGGGEQPAQTLRCPCPGSRSLTLLTVTCVNSGETLGPVSGESTDWDICRMLTKSWVSGKGPGRTDDEC